MNKNDLVRVFGKVVVSKYPFVIFANGTCVILAKPEADVAAQAIALLKEWGPVHGGGPAGDFSVIKLQEEPGWLVGGQHSDILTYVSPEELAKAGQSDVLIGLHGRLKRGQDASDLNVIHVERR